MRLAILRKAKKVRPIGYVSPGGYKKTAAGWVKVRTGGDAKTAPKKSAPKSASKKLKKGPPQFETYNLMGVISLKKAAKELNLIPTGLHQQSKELFANVIYQAAMVEYLGFKNRHPVGIKYAKQKKAGGVISTSRKGVVYADYSMPSTNQPGLIRIGKDHPNSFVHEFTHHMWYSKLETFDVRMARWGQSLGTENFPKDVGDLLSELTQVEATLTGISKTHAERNWKKFLAPGKRTQAAEAWRKYITSATETFARAGDAWVDRELKARGIRPDVVMTSKSAIDYELTEDAWKVVDPIMRKILAKSLIRLVIGTGRV